MVDPTLDRSPLAHCRAQRRAAAGRQGRIVGAALR